MKIKTKNMLMKFFAGFGVAMLFAGIFVFSACSKQSQKGNFNKDEIYVSVGQVFDLTNYYEGETEGLGFLIEDETYVQKTENGFKALASGSTYIFAEYYGQKSDYILVNIKYEFLSPLNIAVSEQGLITWDEVTFSGQEEKATYQIEVKGEGFEQIIDCQTNSYQLAEKGVYEVRVKANQTDKVDESRWSEWVTLYYLAMEPVKNIKFTANKNFENVKGILTWDNVEGARASYNVLINNVLFETNLPSLEIDLSKLDANRVSIIVESVDVLGNKKSTKSEEFQVEKLSAPKITYKNGLISWTEVTGASSYILRYENLEDGSYKEVTTVNTFSNLPEAKEGEYRVFVQAVAEDVAICNSNVARFSQTAIKLSSPVLEFSKDGNEVTVTVLTQSDYIKDFELSFNDEVFNLTADQSYEEGFKAVKTFTLSEAGAYKFNARSLPKIEDGEIVGINGNKNIVTSDEGNEIIIYKLDVAENFSHSVDENGNSILTFDNIENAETFYVEVNGINISDVVINVAENTTLNLGELDRELFEIADGESVEFNVIANRNEESNTISSNFKKTIKVLSSPHLEIFGGEDIGSQVYSWQAVEGAKYRYEIYKTENSLFNIDGVSPQILETTNSHTKNLEEGFYVIRVYSLSKDLNEYIDSNGYSEDRFIVSKKFSNPLIKDFYLSNDGTAYEISFSVSLTESEGINRYYEIYVDAGLGEELIASAEVIGEDIIYKFLPEYDFSSGNSVIKIRTVCKDTELSKIYTPSDYSSLYVERLPQINEDDIVVDENQVLTINLKENANAVVFEKDGQILVDDGVESQAIDLLGYVGNFGIRAYYKEYRTYSQPFTNANIYLQGPVKEILFEREQAPRNFVYQNEMIYFDHNGKATNYVLDINIKTLNDQKGKTWRCVINEKELVLDKLKEIFADDIEFLTCYSQKTELNLGLYADINQFIEGKYYLPSINSTASDGVARITITQLARVEDLDFDKQKNSLVWTSSNPTSTVYEIYYNGEFRESVSSPVSTNGDIKNYEYSLAWLLAEGGETHSFYVKAKKQDSLASTNSTEVLITKLMPLNEVLLSPDLGEGKYYIKWKVEESQLNFIDKVNVNGFEYNLSDASQFLIEDNVNQISIFLVARDSFNEGNQRKVFLNSDTSNFTIKKAIPVDYNSNLSAVDNFLEWEPYLKEGSELEGVENFDYSIYSNILRYMISAEMVIDGETITYYKDISGLESLSPNGKNQFSLNDKFFKQFSSGEIKINVFAYLKEYTVNSNDTVLYCFNKINSSELIVKKLPAVSSVSYSFKTQDQSSSIDEEKLRKVRIAWDFGEDIADVTFEIVFNYSDSSSQFTTSEKFIDVDQGLFTTDLKISIRAKSPTNISGEEIVSRPTVASVPEIMLSDDGELNIQSDNIIDEYLIEIKIDESVYTLRTSQKNVNILNYYKGHILGKELFESEVKVIVIGREEVFASKEAVILKNSLGSGAVEFFGNSILLSNQEADSVTIIYDNGEGKQEVSILGKTNLYVYNNPLDSRFKFMFSQQALSNHEIESLEGYTYKEVFVFDIPLNLNGKFTYYFEKEGVLSSWFDQGLEENYQSLIINKLENIDEIFFNIDNDTNNVSAFASNAANSINSLGIRIYEIKQGQRDLVAMITSTENLIPVWEIENILDGLNLGEYEFEVVSLTENDRELKTVGLCEVYAFKFIKKGNEISSARIDNSGYLTWNDNGEGPYTVVNGLDKYIVSEKYFDIRLLGQATTQEFMIFAMGNIPYGAMGEKDGALSSIDCDKTFISPSTPSSFTLNNLQFTQDCISNYLSQDGVISFESYDSQDILVYAKVEDLIVNVPIFRTIERDGKFVYQIREITLIELFDEFITNSEKLEVEFSLTIPGKIKTTSMPYSLDLRKNYNDFNAVLEQFKDGTFMGEYINYTSSLSETINKANLRVYNEQNDLLFDDVVDVLNGFWVEQSDILAKGFYKEKPLTDPSAEITSVNMIDILSILNGIPMQNGETYFVNVAPIHINEGEPIQFAWLPSLSYTRLNAPENLAVSDYGENIIWTDEDEDLNLYQYRLTKKEKSLGGVEYLYISKDKKFVNAESFLSGKSYDIELVGVSDKAGFVYSLPLTLENVKRNNAINQSNVSLENGTLSLSWDAQGLTESEKALLSSDQNEVKNLTIEKIFEEGNFIKILELIEFSNYYFPSLNELSLDVAKRVLNTVYLYPFSFSINSIDSEIVDLRFVLENDKEYSISVKAIDLLRRIDAKYKDILKNLRMQLSPEYLEANKLLAFETLLTNQTYFNGIPNNQILFDEIDDGDAEKIVAGKYVLYAKQRGNSSNLTLQSDYSKILQEAEVLPAPIMKTHKEDVKNSNGEVIRSDYYLKFKPVYDISGNIKNDYVLRLKSNYFIYPSIDLQIQNGPEGWKISLNEQEVVLTVDDSGFVSILMKSNQTQKGLDYLTQFDDCSYNASVYAKGTDNQFNSKSDIIKIAYLKQKELSVLNGEISWAVYNLQGESFNTRVISQPQNTGLYNVEVVSAREGGRYLPENAGAYNFISFMTLGRVSDFEMFIDSDIYMIENIFKLYQPSLLTSDGQIQINDNSNNNFVVGDDYVRKYRIHNNASGSLYLITDEMEAKAYYQAGLNSYSAEFLQYKMTEQNASIFYVENVGISDSLNFNYDKIDSSLGNVKLGKLQSNENGKIYLRSATSSISAQMLESTEISIDEEGNFAWNPVEKSNALESQLKNEPNKLIVYTVTVEHYRKTSTSSGIKYVLDEGLTQTLYTQNTKLSSDIIQVENDGITRYYKIKVQAMLYALNGSGESILTVEGKRLYKLENEKYLNEDYILRSENISNSDNPVERTKSVSDPRIEDGKIKWDYYDNSDDIKFIVYYSKTSAGTTKNILQGSLSRIVNEVTFDCEQELQANVPYYFWVKAVDLNRVEMGSVSQRFESEFYKLPTFEKSDINILDNVDNGVTQFNLDFSSYKNRINTLNGSKNYFKLKVLLKEPGGVATEIILNPEENMQVIARVETGVNDPDSKTIYIPSGELDVCVRAMSKDNSKVLNAQESEWFSYSQLSWSEEDTIVFNDDSQSFEWTYGKQTIYEVAVGTQYFNFEEGEYILQGEIQQGQQLTIIQRNDEWTSIKLLGDNETISYVKTQDLVESISYKDATEITYDFVVTTVQKISETQTTITENIVTRTYSNLSKQSFTPTLNGKITSVSVRLRKGENSFVSDPLLQGFEDGLELRLFTSGEGTKENPYIIENEQDFQKINIRAVKEDYLISYDEHIIEKKTNKLTSIVTNTDKGTKIVEDSGREYYFRQNSDLLLDIENMVTAPFGGIYDGQNFKISLICEESFDYSKNVNYKEGNIDFEKGFSVFKTTLEGAVLKNLSLSASYVFDQQQNFIFAGLVLENNGLIENVKLESFDFDFAEALVDGKTLAIGGIVGINNGKISNCHNHANISLSNNYSGQQESKILLSGIVFQNKGEIFKATNINDIIVDFSSPNNLDVAVGGIATINSAGKIDLCGNEGSINLSNINGVISKAGGIVGYTSYGEIVYSWNNGVINATRGGGIAYTFDSNKLENSLAYGLVNGGVNKIFFGTATEITSNNNYTYSSYVDSYGMSFLTRSEDFEIAHSEAGYKIVVKYNNSLSYTIDVAGI